MVTGRSGAAQNDLMAKWPEMPQSSGTCSAVACWTCFGKPGLMLSGRRYANRTTRRKRGAVTAVGQVPPDAHDRPIRRHLLRLSNVEKAPDHSRLSHTRSGLPQLAPGFELNLITECGLVLG